MLIETDRLLLRPLIFADEPALAAVLSDAETMLWYPRPYTADEVRQRIGQQMGRYPEGSGLLGMVEKRTGKLIGDCGPTWQEVEGRMELEIGYHVNRERWNQGFATEAAKAVMDYAFRRFNVDRVISMIRPENMASRRVAEKNGLTVDRVVFWRDYDHCVYQRMRSR
ncbi:MAG: GNAT family N-acetyltransferase [Silvibacterium sp.]|nr:GNAT family N-acetyltransferase [Silvibacterium sp.]MBV8438140.1 GNAT family N-acetyltransferase [Silvibacterium sp.]